MDTSYQKLNKEGPTKRENSRYRGISYRLPIDEAKRLVPVIDLADWLCGPGKMRPVGIEWASRCPLPDHEDRSPSFTVNPQKNVWFCHGCLRGGDVVELARLAWDYTQREAHTAAAMLLMEYGHEVPQRPAAYFRKRERQAAIRSKFEEVKVNSARRRLLRTLRPLVESIEDPGERHEEMQRIWRDLEAVARLIVREGRR